MFFPISNYLYMVETHYSLLLQFLCTMTLAWPHEGNVVLPVCVLLITLPLILIHYLLAVSQVYIIFNFGFIHYLFFCYYIWSVVFTPFGS